MPAMRGRCGRVNRRSGRILPSAPPHQGWGTTGSTTRTGCKGSGSELRFSFGWVAWYESIIGGGEGARGTRCASASGGTLKPPVIEVSITEDLTIDQFEHTKLIGHHITLGINSVVPDVSVRTLIAAEV